MSEAAPQSKPYRAPQSLRPVIQAELTPQTRQLYLDVFESAWRRYADFADREPFCHRLARVAVRRHLSSLVASPGPTDTSVRVVARN